MDKRFKYKLLRVTKGKKREDGRQQKERKERNEGGREEMEDTGKRKGSKGIKKEISYVDKQMIIILLIDTN